VVLILEELNIPYEINSFKFEDVKKKPFTDLNPNGRVPGIFPNPSIFKSFLQADPR
jgi:glutathione S-transferase